MVSPTADPAGTDIARTGPGPDTSADELVAALEWMSDRLARSIDGSDESDRSEAEDDAIPWGIDAGSFPPEYWHWLHLHSMQRSATGEGDALRLPTDGPLVSVVVPVYRPALWYFRECVQSVVAQTYQNWELCLCDDASGDAELTSTMAELAAMDDRIKVTTHHENGGISRATNTALTMAKGELVALLDHDDLLEPEALAEVAAAFMADDDVDVVYTDDDKYDEADRPFQPHFKPDWSPDLLLSYPYLGHLTVIRHDLVRRIGGFRPEFDGSQDFDIMLRATEHARRIVHVPRVLYHWRVVAGSAAGDPDAKPWAHDASRRALADAVVRRGIDGEVDGGPFLGAYHVRRRIQGSPSVSIVIPFRDQASLTAACLRSLEQAPGYDIGEVVLIDNGSTEPETRALRAWLATRPATRVIDYPGPFNWAAINNEAARTCDTDMLLFLNNDIEARSEGWLHALVELGQRNDVGAVGARLLYPDGSVQHAGVVLGMGGIAGHVFAGLPAGHLGYAGWDRVVREYSAVTAACMLVRRDVFTELDGFDERFAVGFNDVDFCLRLGRAGYRVLYTPHAELTHFESVSRGLSGFYRDYQHFLGRWADALRAGDPYYNPNLSRIDPWCPLRPPGEDDRWLSMVDGLVQHVDHREPPAAV